MINITLIGIMIVCRNLEQPEYTFNEYWIWFVLYWKYIGYFFFLKWRRVVAWFYVVMIVYIILLNWYYNRISFTFYSSILITWAIFPVTLVFISQKIKEMIILLKTKRDLIHTIRSILQIFPEGVIIKSIDPVSKRTVIKFANDVAYRFLNKAGEGDEISDNLKVHLGENLQQNSDEKMSLSEFLLKQELQIDTNRFENSSEIIRLDDCSRRVEEIKEFIRNSKDEIKNKEKSEFYNIKSIKVQWDNLDSFMHVFINTTQVYSLYCLNYIKIILLTWFFPYIIKKWVKNLSSNLGEEIKTISIKLK